MTIQTKINTKAVIAGDQFKEVKNIYKGYKKSNVKNYPILQFVKFEIHENNTATVTYATTRLTVQKQIELLEGVKGSFLVPIDTLRKVTRIKNDSIYSFEYDAEKNQLHFNNNGIKQRLITALPEEYPELPTVSRIKKAGSVNYNDLQSIKAANISTSSMDSRPILKYVVLRGNKVISTDSHRLYQNTLETLDTSNDILLHEEMVKSLVGNENKKDFKASIGTNEHREYTFIETEKGNKYLYRNNGGNYPQTDRLIPNEFNNVFTIHDVEFFKNIVENISKLSKERNSVMRFEIKDNNTLRVYAKLDEVGSVDELINIHSDYVEEGFKISFSSKYMLDAIKQTTNKKTQGIKFNLMGAMRPFIVNDIDNEDEFSLLLPVRVY